MARDAEALVALKNVSHQYGDDEVLRDVDWHIQPGDQWAILGPNGAGKTTLVEIAAGYRWPNRGGTVTRFGQEQYDLSQWRTQVGWLSTDLLSKIPDRQSVKDTVLAGALGQTRLAERPDLSLSDEDYRAANYLLDTMDLSGKEDRPFSSLSQGETQLVLVARALISEPELVVLDEPCAGLDPGSREQFLTILNTVLTERNQITTIFISHHVEELTPVFDSLLTLRDGEVLQRGPIGDVLTENHLNELYGTSFELIERHGRRWAIRRQ